VGRFSKGGSPFYFLRAARQLEDEAPFAYAESLKNIKKADENTSPHGLMVDYFQRLPVVITALDL